MKEKGSEEDSGIPAKPIKGVSRGYKKSVTMSGEMQQGDRIEVKEGERGVRHRKVIELQARV